MTQQNDPIYSIEALNDRAKALLETEFLSVGVTGEISNFSQPRSGHWYFSLKDNNAQIRAAMFRFRNSACSFNPQNGTQVLAYGKVSLYTARGDYQLIIDRMEPAGQGALQQAFAALKAQLKAKGWFEDSLKIMPPEYPETIGIITSATGAALQDIVSVLQRRAPCIAIKLFSSVVQGSDAAAQLTHQLKQADQDPSIDVILLARGGGSIEDLWPFNEEAVAKAIFDCQTPVVTGIGHQTDFTIADFVADLRAPTPSAAAELLSYDQSALRLQFSAYEKHLFQNIHQHILNHKQSLWLLKAQLKRPDHKLEEWLQKLDGLDTRLLQAMQRRLEQEQQRIQYLSRRLAQQTPLIQLPMNYQSITTLKHRQQHAWQRLLSQLQQQLQYLTSQLHSLSPLNTVKRGYSITRLGNKDLVTSTKQVMPGDLIDIEVQDGHIQAHVC